MPSGDGRELKGQGPLKERGQGGSVGFGASFAAFCKCVACGEKVARPVITPCYEAKCPKCGGTMRGI